MGITDMKTITRERGTAEWRRAKLFHIMAADVPHCLASTETRRYRDLINRLVFDFENIGHHIVDDPPVWQLDHEAELRAATSSYCERIDEVLYQTGLVEHDRHSWLAASPHGFLGVSGLVHFRCRDTLRTFMSGRTSIPKSLQAKLQTDMYITGCDWCDVVDYWNGEARVPDRFYVNKVKRNDDWFMDVVLPRLAFAWQTVSDTLRNRRSSVLTS